MREQNIKTAGNADDFMAGVALFDGLLREAEGRGSSDGAIEANSMNLDGEYRAGGPLSLFALRFVEALIRRPELARGFAGALGDYVGMVVEGSEPPNPGAFYERLTFEDCIKPRSTDDERPMSNVVPIGNAKRAALGGAPHA